MKRKNNHGFTLVELIVVITILAILGTIAFITIGNYALDARNSARISDISSIEGAIELYQTTEGKYPNPDNSTAISYSGSVMWNQGIFGTGTLSTIQRLSKMPIDPILKQSFDYSLTSAKNKYQLGIYIEALTNDSFLMNQSYALSNDGLEAYVRGTYDLYDLNAKSGTGCTLVTTPSLFITNPPLNGELSPGGIYGYSYNLSKNIPPNIGSYITTSSSGIPFQIEEVLNSCSINTIADLNLYIAKLSTAYQQFSTVNIYEDVVFSALSDSFKISAINQLRSNGISIPDSLLKSLKSPIPDNIFTDIFTGTDNDLLVGDHIAVTGTGSWVLTSGSSTAYEINNDSLVKTDNSLSLVHPLPSPPITSSGSLVSFDIESFGGGEIISYLRYTDINNYYAIGLDAGGYKLSRMLGGVEDIFSDISDPISIGSTIKFSAYGDSLSFSVNNIEKETILASGIDSIGLPVIYLPNVGTSIDNYTLIYK